MNRREKILLTAKELFAQKGFDGTTVDEIAEASSTNKAMIYYYFKNKEKLYETAFKHSLESVFQHLNKSISNMQNPEDALSLYIKTLYEYGKNDEAFLRMLMREIASNGEHFPAPVVETFLKIVKILDTVLQNGCESGVFIDKNTKIVHFIILGTISFLLTSTPVRTKMSEKLLPDFLKDDEETLESLIKIILRGLKKT